MSLLNQTGARGVLLISGFILVLVGSILAMVEALRGFGMGRVDPSSVAVFVLAIVALLGSLMIWMRRTDEGAIMGIVAAIVFLVLFPETAGILVLVGSTLALVAHRVTTIPG